MTIEVALRYEGINPKAYEHPADRAATAALKSIPLMDQSSGGCATSATSGGCAKSFSATPCASARTRSPTCGRPPAIASRPGDDGDDGDAETGAISDRNDDRAQRRAERSTSLPMTMETS